jgi:hypothetical protein
MFFSIVCTHDFTPSRRDRLLAADQQILPEARAALEPGVLAYFEICPQWPSRDADPKASVPVSSAAPTLLVNGQFDPITPPAYGERAAQTLSKSVVVTLPGGGHAPTWFSASPVGQCGEAIVLRFFADPSKSPDTSCVAALRLTFQALPPELAGPSPAPSPTPTPAPTAVVPGLPNTGAGGSLRAAPDADGAAAPTEGEARTLPLALGALGAMAAVPILVRRWRRARRAR